MPDDVIQKRIDDLQKQQIAFEERTEKSITDQMQSFAQLAMNTIADAGMANFGTPVQPSSENDEATVGDHHSRLLDLEQENTGKQKQIAFRYRNDGAEGEDENIHRLEFIMRPTPYLTGTTPYPNDQWTPILGSDAVVGN